MIIGCGSVTLDWKADATEATDNFFFTATVTFEEGAPVNDRFNEVFQIANTVRTYHLGAEMKIEGGFTILLKVPPKKVTSAAVVISTALRTVPVSTGNPVTVIYHCLACNMILSAVRTPGDGSYGGFINPWEGTSDMLIAEHERYGELIRTRRW